MDLHTNDEPSRDSRAEPVAAFLRSAGRGAVRWARQLAQTNRPRGRARINLALQGGGAHGAFTWGVLDRLLEEPDLELVGISGASAGAVNAVVAASGLAEGGREGARAALERFWLRVATEARRSSLSPTAVERALGLAGAGRAARQVWLEGVARVASPYDLDPSGRNPLADLLADSVDFARLRRDPPVRLFLSATNFSATGLGDILPLSPVARVITVVAQWNGVMYMALIVSRLAGMIGGGGHRED